MNIIVVKNQEQLAEKAYEKMLSVINSKEEVTLGLATGGSPKGIYQLFRERKPACNHVVAINLDEYIGLDKNHEQSYYQFMQEQLFNTVPFKATYIPDGVATDLEQACADYEEICKQHPIDLQLLGLGENGHIAFNEPGTPFDSVTHVINLTESTIQANSRYFDNIDHVPKTAITKGIATILKAEEILLIAHGKNKAQAVKDMIEGPYTTDCPASALQKHPNVTVILDEAAASLLS